ncbi:MAG: SDR family oxidoreductase [Proteobacteria bacterium]|nr:SDR family oxidoreductase [Pseudomonadota bacterium]
MVLITGASAGIGRALAQEFAVHGHELALVARRGDALAALADEIASGGRPRPALIVSDLTVAGAGERIAAELSARGLEPAYVVNNAGFGLLGPAAELDRRDQLAMIDVNVRVLVELSLAFIDALARYRGGIINVASVAGFLPGPGMAVYYASKAFVISFSEALARELAPRGVRVTILCPGPVPTEFQVRAGLPRDYSPKLIGNSAQVVARAAYAGLMQGRTFVVPGALNRVITMLPRFLPRRVVARAMAFAQQRRFGRPAAP